MKYKDGRSVVLGDQVQLHGGTAGCVVCVFDEQMFSGEYSQDNWSYLERGVLIKFEDPGITYYLQIDESVHLVARTRSGGQKDILQ